MNKKPEILAVDDMPANLEVAIETLSSAGYTVAAVTSGKRALKRLGTYVPDLILLDVQMPEMDGFELCQKIKANPETADIPIVFITALSDTESIAKGFSLGAVDYITKPFREVEVLARVKTHLQLRNLTKNLEQQVKQRTADLSEALQQLQSSQMQLVQSEKMATLGNLVAGVGHEINNPLSFIGGNLKVMKANLADLFAIIEGYQEEFPNPSPQLAENLDALDLDFLLEDLPQAIVSMEEGMERIKNISTSLRIFSRSDTKSKAEFNLSSGIDSTIMILKYRLKANQKRPAIEIIKAYGNVPEVKCYPGQLNQVFMNILANAIDVFDETSEDCSFEYLKEHPQQIRIVTEQIDDWVIARIADNGKGMSQEIEERIFDQGYTTKGVGKGTGLGLAIAHQIVVEKHGGRITCKSELGKGTEFAIALPLN